ncbi:MAG: 6-phosphofructokinase [Candidatus Fournierella pullistercoris]|uniref:Pyrophosphate--fructose 6-phosphate 1-phosphotransferase n=1 Tax=Candidatus Allofournierella pullistercoris TaxID=2838597 RepID=A0A948T1D0_9FIRM|nr:6-phosphofructokinase [Candidatus Fournierella pullistercoris]
MGMNFLVGQSGGPTAVINSSLAGVYATARQSGAGKIYGMQYGIQGLLDEKLVDLDEKLGSNLSIELLKRTPSSYLGSCRYKLPTPEENEAVYHKLFALFAKYEIDAVLYIGGNDSMDTIAKLSAYGASIGSPIRFIGVPKTIDNDLMLTDHTPGFASAGKFIATITKELICDSNVYDLQSVTVAEIMGRHAGWLAACASLAKGDDCDGPDMILLPEVAFSTSRFLEQVEKIRREKNNIIIAASEGVKTEDGTFLCDLGGESGPLDAFGHKAALSGTSRYLAGLIQQHLGCKTRAIEFSTLQRCASHLTSRIDINESFQVGGAAVQAALNGETGRMSAIIRQSNVPYQSICQTVDVQAVANKEKVIPRSWISEDGTQLTAEFEAYARPLIQGEQLPIFVNGVPQHIRL